MKILKYLLSIIGILVVLFFAIGFIKPSVTYGHEIEVNKSIKESWAVVQDESKLGEWLDGFKSIEHLSGTPGEVGSTYKVTVQPEGQPDFVMTETINAVKEYDHIDLNFDSDMMVFNQITSFSEKDGKTVIKTDSKVNGKGMIMSSMFALMEMMGGAFQKQEVKNIERLKILIETNTKDYFPAPVLVEEVMEETAN